MNHDSDARPLSAVTQQCADSDRSLGPVTLIHGFTQNARCWGRFADRLAERSEVTRIDLPGHGSSRHDQANLADAADLIARSTGPSTWIGYSLGGRVALHGALDQRNAVERLVVIGAHPGLEDPAARAERVRLDNERADHLLTIGLKAWLDEWLSLPLFAQLDPDAAARSERLTNRAEGLAASLRNCGTGTQVPLWERLDKIDVPTLVIAGSLDERFAALGRRMVDHIGANAQLELIAGAGHACHLEDPTATSEVISRFLGASPVPR